MTGKKVHADRRQWWERENLPVPPAWTPAHPDHPAHVEQPRRRERSGRGTGQRVVQPEDFGL